MIEAHIAHPVDGSFNIFDGIPGLLAVRDLRELLVKFVIQLEKIG